MFASLGFRHTSRIAWLGFLGLLLFLTLLNGLCTHAGGDWRNYLPYSDCVDGLPIAAVLRDTENGYGLLNWSGANWGGGVYLVNTLCGLIFTIGLLRLAGPRPALGLRSPSPFPNWRWWWPWSTPARSPSRISTDATALLPGSPGEFSALLSAVA